MRPPRRQGFAYALMSTGIRNAATRCRPSSAAWSASTSQGVRATATAEVVFSNSSSCVKPLAILDRWSEVQSPGWDPGDTFDRYEPPPAPVGTLLANPDTYQPVAPPGNNGSGFDLSDPVHGYGLELHLVRRIGPPAPPDSVNWYIPVQLDCQSETPGSAACVIENITSCSPQTLRPDDVVPLQVAGLSPLGVDLLAPALASLVDADPSASWDTGANGGRGGIVGGCMASGACAVSPRLIALPMVNPQIWADQSVDPDVPPSHVTVTRVVGLFVDDVVGSRDRWTADAVSCRPVFDHRAPGSPADPSSSARSS